MTTWLPPGAGQWKRDEAHIDGVLTGYIDSILPAAQTGGFADGFAYYGAMLAGFDVARVAGHIYMRPVIAGAPKLPIWGDAPPKTIKPPGKAPPRFVFKLLFLLHPEMRRRAKRAKEVWEKKLWREMARRWRDELRPKVEAETLARTRTDVAKLDDRALAEHLDAATRAFREMLTQHFRQAPMQAIVVGDYMVRAMEWTGASASEVLGTLRGASPASRAGATETMRIARALRDDAAMRAVIESGRPAREVLDMLAKAPSEIGRVTTAYLEKHGLRPFTGLDLYEQALIDHPEIVVRSIRAAMAALERGEAVESAEDPIASLRARTPEARRTELDDAYEEARLAYGVRDDDVGVTMWANGVMAHAIREAGRRLKARGAVHDATHVYDAQPAELVALVRGEKGPSADELRTRAATRAEQEAMCPPYELGEAGEPPAPECFPPAVARMMKAVFTFLRAFDGEGQTRGSEDGVRGVGVSPGVYEGRARLVRGVEDFARIEAGDVLVTPFTAPTYNVLLPLLGGIVTERGGLLSHAAIVAREYGIPAVVDTRNAMARIADGSRVRVDGVKGTVEVIGKGRREEEADNREQATGNREPGMEEEIVVAEPTTNGRVVALREAGDGEFGGKAKALAAAMVAQLPVPDGLALDADLVERVVRGESEARARVAEAAAKVKGPWAVRSSAIGEDSANASFAGQHATVLGVSKHELVDAITRVHASGHTASAKAYRARMGVGGAPRMGVVIQTLLRPDVSGVLFSRDPSAKREGRVIEATWGLGEALVSGLVTPDRYRVGADGKLLERAIGDKDIAIEARPAGGTAEVAVAGDRAKTACLDEKRLAELAALATRCEQLFGGPQDLEWAISGDRLHLLQSRPVTTSARG